MITECSSNEKSSKHKSLITSAKSFRNCARKGATDIADMLAVQGAVSMRHTSGQSIVTASRTPARCPDFSQTQIDHRQSGDKHTSDRVRFKISQERKMQCKHSHMANKISIVSGGALAGNSFRCQAPNTRHAPFN